MSRIVGFPIVFGSRSVNLGGFYEYVSPHAVDRTLKADAPLVALVNHDSSKPIGRRSAGTLAAHKDAHGLFVDVSANGEISYVADVIELIRRGDADGGSFGFEVVDDIWSSDGKTIVRELLDINLVEVSAGVTFPAYSNTRFSIRRA